MFDRVCRPLPRALAKARALIFAGLVAGVSFACDGSAPSQPSAPVLQSPTGMDALDATATSSAGAPPSGATDTGGEVGGGAGAPPAGRASGSAADVDAGARNGDGPAGPDAPDAGVAAPGAADAVIVPHASWTCGMPEGIPVPADDPARLTIDAQVAATLDVGQTPYGRRTLRELGDGTLSGEGIAGSLHAGALDYQLDLERGTVEVEQVMLLRTDDGESIYLRTCGVAPAAGEAVRIVADFEAASAGDHADLNDGPWVGTRTLSADGASLSLRIARVDTAAGASASIAIDKPPGLPAQPWECAAASGSPGAVRFTERVEIGGSVTVGASKRGSRSAIPITGGSTSGEITGRVRAGGADYQLRDDDFRLDARYTLETDAGELILVRNCGPASALVPVFETRADGPHAWLNDGAFLSSSPGLAIGAVNIAIYDAD